VWLGVEKDYYIATHDVPRMTFMLHEKRACMHDKIRGSLSEKDGTFTRSNHQYSQILIVFIRRV
jgi:hypothetical protein